MKMKLCIAVAILFAAFRSVGAETVLTADEAVARMDGGS